MPDMASMGAAALGHSGDCCRWLARIAHFVVRLRGALSSTFTWASGATGGGLFAGTAASHAGASYNFSAGGYTDVSGAVAFKR